MAGKPAAKEWDRGGSRSVYAPHWAGGEIVSGRLAAEEKQQLAIRSDLGGVLLAKKDALWTIQRCAQ